MAREQITSFAQALRILNRASEQASGGIRQRLFAKGEKNLDHNEEKGAFGFMQASNLKESVRDLKDQASRHMHDAKDRVSQASREAVDRMDEEAHRNPWAFVGIAAIFSMIIGFFIGRSSRR